MSLSLTSSVSWIGYLAFALWLATPPSLVQAQSHEGTAEPEFSAEEIRFFESQVKPILEQNCYKCHSTEKQRGGLRLDHRSLILRGGDLGPAVDLEDLSDTQLMRAIRYEDLEMPPDGKLPDDQINILDKWVSMKLPWPPGEVPAEISEPAEKPAHLVDDEARAHWAYRPLTTPSIPQVQDGGWCQNPIDRFVLHRLEEANLTPNPPASRQTQLRRLHFDLLGLPPTLAEVHEFEQDNSPHAYADRVDAYLNDAQFGVKWGRHWLDLVRYAETNGYERDGPKANAWRYRDYVIAAMNSGKPYDEFVCEQLAGDEMPDRDSDSWIATGFYRMGLWDDEPVDADQAFYDNLDDVVSTTSLVFMATTVGCARCHDHKIDPIPQRDYYRMMAFFHNTYNNVRQLQFKKSAFTLNTQTDVATPEQRREQQAQQQLHEARIDSLQADLNSLSDKVYESFSNPEKEDARDDNVRRHMIQQRAKDVLNAKEFAAFQDLGRQIQRLRRRAPAPMAQALTIKENGRTAPETFVLIRGNAHALGEQVEPGFLSVVSESEPEIVPLPEDYESSGRRLAFARWLVSPDHPLTARVIVNRIWQHHFGRGIVRTTSDFGRYGDRPTHPELLDYLASELVRHDWDLKWLHQLILNSATYQMASDDRPDALAQDPQNNLFWRFEMRRLTAEELRDTVLSVSGDLNLEMEGPSIYSKIPDQVLQSASRPDAAWGKSSPSNQVRRSVYIFQKRSISDPVLVGFDTADKDSSCPVRFATTVPTQALTTLNGEFFNEQAGRFAARLRRDVGDDDAAFVERAFEIALGRAASKHEIERGTQLITAWQETDGMSPHDAQRLFALLTLNLNEMVYID